MSYEYNAANGRFEIANPYRIENAALFVAGGVGVLAGVSLLIAYRDSMSGVDAHGLKGVLVGLFLLTLGILPIGRALVQLRYYFGRGRPKDLVGAPWLKENFRQNSLIYKEPQGPISNLVHYFLDTLIFAPQLVRAAAETQCFNVLVTVALLLGSLVGLFFYPDGPARSWIALGFGLPLALRLIRPFSQGNATFARAHVGLAFIVFVIAAPILVPPLLNGMKHLPDISGFHLTRTLILCLVILLLAQALFFMALIKQLRPRPTINIACEQRAVTLNGNPTKLFEELERVLQTRWTESIPNRLYAKVKLPDIVTGKSGSFAGEVLEETQPTPGPRDGGTDSVTGSFQATSTRYTASLTALATVSYCAATIVAVTLATANLGYQDFVSRLILVAVLFLVAWYCRDSAHDVLLGRVDFDSTLLWIECAGSFEESQLNIGNQLTTGMSSSKRIVNVESMTLRVWAAELDSVVFSKDGERDLIGMRGRPDLAKLFADHLETFAAGMSSVVAPTTSTDQARIAAMAQVQRQLAVANGQPADDPVSRLGAAAHSTVKTQIAPTAARCRNTKCLATLSPAALFCSACGTSASG